MDVQLDLVYRCAVYVQPKCVNEQIRNSRAGKNSNGEEMMAHLFSRQTHSGMYVAGFGIISDVFVRMLFIYRWKKNKPPLLATPQPPPHPQQSTQYLAHILPHHPQKCIQRITLNYGNCASFIESTWFISYLNTQFFS